MTIVDLIPALLHTGRFRLLMLCSTKDGWCIDFQILDLDLNRWVEGDRVFNVTTEFTDEADLLSELWNSPRLTDAPNYPSD